MSGRFNIGEEEAKIFLFAGRRGTGKSTTQLKLIKAWLSGGGRALVIPSNPYEKTYRRVPRIKPEEIENIEPGKMAAIDCSNQDDIKEVLQYTRDLLLILDDMKNYLPSNGLNSDVRMAFASSRHININIVISVHGLTQVAPEFFNFLDVIFLYRTDDNLMSHSKKFKDVKGLQELQKIVNDKASKKNEDGDFENKYYYMVIEY